MCRTLSWTRPFKMTSTVERRCTHALAFGFVFLQRDLYVGLVEAHEEKLMWINIHTLSLSNFFVILLHLLLLQTCSFLHLTVMAMHIQHQLWKIDQSWCHKPSLKLVEGFRCSLLIYTGFKWIKLYQHSLLRMLCVCRMLFCPEKTNSCFILTFPVFSLFIINEWQYLYVK